MGVFRFTPKTLHLKGRMNNKWEENECDVEGPEIYQII